MRSKLSFSSLSAKRQFVNNAGKIDLRSMLSKAGKYRPDYIEGRWVIETLYQRKSWEIIVEPDYEFKLLVAVTAYQL